MGWMTTDFGVSSLVAGGWTVHLLSSVRKAPYPSSRSAFAARRSHRTPLLSVEHDIFRDSLE